MNETSFRGVGIVGRMRGEAGDHGHMNGFPKTGTRVWYKSIAGRKLQYGDYPGQKPKRAYRPIHATAVVGPSAPWLFQDWNFSAF